MDICPSKFVVLANIFRSSKPTEFNNKKCTSLILRFEMDSMVGINLVPTKTSKSPMKRKTSDQEEKEPEPKKVAKINDNIGDGNNSDTKKKITGISELHRYCNQHKLQLPCYKIVEVTDFSNNKVFTVQCNIRSVYETASAGKKKEAKHKASYLLLERLIYNAKYCNNDDIKDNDNESLEEGEINDLEEGEIKEPTNNNLSDNNDLEDIEVSENLKNKSYKVYLEGNITKTNRITNVNNVSTDKSDIESLAEFCFEQKLPSPRYEMNEYIGINSPIFTCRCSVLQLVIRMSGSTKIEAKEKASKMLLAKMKQHVNILKVDSGADNKSARLELEEGEIIDNNENGNNKRKRCKPQLLRKRKNPFSNDKMEQLARAYDLGMGELYNFCVKIKIPPPIYKLISKRDYSATKTVFTFRCSVLKFSKIGKGLNKKQAKHKAARLVLTKLQNWNKTELQQENDEVELLEEGKLTDKDELVKNEFMKYKLDNNFISHEEKNSLQLQSITERHDIINTGKPYTDSIIIKKLKEIDNVIISKHAVTILRHLCRELKCSYNFINFKSPKRNIIAVFLNSIPPWSTFGRGETPNEAKMDSVAKLLIFFKNMTT